MENMNISIVRMQLSDRNIVLFTSAEHNVLQGINFWQGCGDDAPLKDFLQPDPAATDWVLKRLRLAEEKWVEFSVVCPEYDELIENINTAISAYIQHRNTPQEFTLPRGYVTDIQYALTLLAEQSKKYGHEYTEFDTIVLRALLNYPVTISVTPEEQETFCSQHGVDFPQFN